LEVVRSQQSDFEFSFSRPHPCYWTFWHFFRNPT